ncbi:MAG: hypothetical protein J7527_16065, partial [Chitinophagaceae bacterium]|nr:hypothetical protein [Chitinophagaceae bacterium]
MRRVYGKYLLACTIVFVLYACTAQKEVAKQSAVAGVKDDSVISRYRIADEYAGTSIELKKGNRFAFVSWDCKVRISSSGSWRQVKDTLILHSDYQKDDVLIRFSFKKVSTDDSVRISYPKDASGKEILFIQVMLNFDSAFNYLMGVDNVSFAQGKIHSLRFDFGNNTRTKW